MMLQNSSKQAGVIRTEKERGIDTVEWEVVIVGNENDLSELAKSLQSETLSVTKDRDRWVLKSNLLNVLSNYEDHFGHRDHLSDDIMD